MPVYVCELCGTRFEATCEEHAHQNHMCLYCFDPYYGLDESSLRVEDRNADLEEIHAAIEEGYDD